MGTTLLSFQDRVVIETLHKEGYSLSQIAHRIGFSRKTVHHELHPLTGTYNARQAEADYQRQKRGFKTTLTAELKALIEQKIIVDKWSPEEVAHVLQIGFKSIYKWIDQGKLDIKLTDLPDRGIRRHRFQERIVTILSTDDP